MVRKLTRRAFLAAGLAMSASAALAACGATPTATPLPPTPVPPTATKAPVPTTAPAAAPTATKAVAPAVTATTAPAATKAPAVTGKEGGVLRTAYTAQRDDLNPFRVLGGVNADSNRRIFSSLTQLDSSINLVGDLAEKWSLGSDGKTWTFNLRKGVKWHDGAPFTSKDVEFTVMRHAHPAAQGFYANTFDPVVGIDDFRADKAATISGLRTPDDFTVVFELKKPYSYFPTSLRLIWIIPKHVLGNIAPADLPKDKFWGALPIGTGPYKLTKYVPKQVLEYERNLNYHLGKPKIDKMIFTMVTSAETQVLALQKGDLDYIMAGINTKETIEMIKKDANLYIMEAYEPRLPQMSIHWRNFPDKRVRQAICYAVDRTALLEAAGGATVAQKMDYYFFNEWARAGAVKWGDVYKYDPAKAKALLQEAKWDSKKELVLLNTGKAPSADMVMIQEQLQAVGMKVKLELVDSMNNAMYVTGEYDLTLSGLAYLDPYQVASVFTCATAKPNGSSLTQHCDPAFDKLLEEEAAAADQTGRAAVYKRMQEMLVNNATSVLTTYQPNRAGFNKKVHVDKWAWYAFDDSWNWWMD